MNGEFSENSIQGYSLLFAASSWWTDPGPAGTPDAFNVWGIHGTGPNGSQHTHKRQQQQHCHGKGN